MKKMGIASFTERGRKRAEEVRKIFLGEYQILPYEKDRGESLKEWCLRCFEEGEALVFVGACGIAVRTIAPFLQDKTKDPAVLVMDEAGRYVISLVSGHLGGANRLALKIAESLGAEPVITTATDVNGKFAVDVFAKDNQHEGGEGDFRRCFKRQQSVSLLPWENQRKSSGRTDSLGGRRASSGKRRGTDLDLTLSAP